MDADECASDVTESSSGLDNGDVTIICQKMKLQRKIEQKLTDMQYKVVDCQIAGREKIKNLMSSAKHSRVRIIILTKNDTSDPSRREKGTFQNDLAPLAGGSCLPFGSTLILHHSSIKKNQVHPYLKKFQLLRLAEDIDGIVKQIGFYIEACVGKDLHNMVMERNELFAFLLVGTCVDMTSNVPISVVATSFEKRHGSFQNLCVGNLKKFLCSQEAFRVAYSDNLSVATSKKGLDFLTDCRKRFFNSYDLRRPRSSHEAEKPQSPVLHSPANAQRPGTSGSIGSAANMSQQTEWETHERYQATSQEEENLWEAEGDQKLFYHKLHFLSSRYAYFMIASKMAYTEELTGLSKIPFLKVFDFDPDSRTSGLLNGVEDAFKEKRNLKIAELSAGVERISDQATHWVFMKGTSEGASAKIWQLRYNRILQETCENMLQHCMLHKPAVFLILWYDGNEDDFLLQFLTNIHRVFPIDLPWEIILCVPVEPGPESVLTEVKNFLNITDGLTVVDQKTVVQWLASCPTSSNKQDLVASVPQRTDENELKDVVIQKQQLPWLNDVLEILSSSLPDDNRCETTKPIGEDFVRGGLLEWDDIRYGNVAVEREIQKDVCEYIKKEAIEECRSIILRIMHAPGGGGTTFGRQLLWSLRKCAPCCVLVPSTYFRLPEIIERIEVLHKATHLPVVILVDGRSDYDVQRLYASRKYAVVLLHVQRNCTGIESSRLRGNSCHLAGKVTCNEAGDLSQLFRKFSPSCRRTLDVLCEDVLAGRQPREVFEFGLAAFDHEFKAVRKYVEGYMGAQHSRLSSQLWWQKIIIYLSLLMYYGQCGVYGELFRKLFPDGVITGQFVTITDVAIGNQFIIEEDGVWKINYNPVAREVLEFTLAGKGKKTVTETGRLSAQAQNNLHELVIEFISYVKSAVGNQHLDTVVNILQMAVTTRDYKNLDASDGLGKKGMLSRMLEDIKLEENRIRVLKEFTKAFPREPEFHAHLGRLCGFYKRFEEAEQSLKEAIRLRINRKKAYDPDKTDNALGRYHHMFGYYCLRKVEHLLDENLKEALQSAQKGVDHFTQGRKFAVYNRIYGYVGEVRIRLLMVEKFREKYNIGRAFTNNVDNEDLALLQFVQVSHAVCDHLLVECQYYSSQSELQMYREYYKCVESYNKNFEGVRLVVKTNDDFPNIPLIRSKIASIKMKHNPRKRRKPRLINITDIGSQDISEVINLLETTIDAALSSDFDYVYISVEMQEWLYAIRHEMVKDDYKLVKVWQRMEQWEKRNEFGFSTFYLYVMHVLLAMFSIGYRQRRNHWDSAMDLFKKLYNSHGQYLIKHKELLADHDKPTIRKLIPGREMGKWDHKRKTWTNEKGIAKLRVCTGTIVKSDQPLFGFICMDLDDPIPDCAIRIFFSPRKHDLHGRRFSDSAKRVEFFIAFNSNNGVEAEYVKLLDKRLCGVCKMKTEVVTLNQPDKGKCLKCGKLFL